jgi:hypothetical protein
MKIQEISFSGKRLAGTNASAAFLPTDRNGVEN